MPKTKNNEEDFEEGQWTEIEIEDDKDTDN